MQVQVCTFVFDCLSINGRTLLREPLTARREAMYSALEVSPGHLEFATAKVGGGAAATRMQLGFVRSCIHAFIPKAPQQPKRVSQRPASLPGHPPSLVPLSQPGGAPRPSCPPPPPPPPLPPAVQQTSRDIEELNRFLDESVEAGTEGLIVKTVAGGRQAGRGGKAARGWPAQCVREDACCGCLWALRGLVTGLGGRGRGDSNICMWAVAAASICVVAHHPVHWAIC